MVVLKLPRDYELTPLKDLGLSRLTVLNSRISPQVKYLHHSA